MTIDNAFYQRIIETCFPDIQVSHIQFLGGGTCRVFAVNQTLIFRFPHGGGSVVSDGLVEDEGAFLWHEKSVYDSIASQLPLPVPRYRYFSAGCAEFPYPVAGYDRIPGRSLSACSLTPQEIKRAAGQIGHFLSALHAIPLSALPTELQPPSPPIMGGSNAPNLFRQVEARAFPLLSPAEQAWTSRLFQETNSDHTLWEITPVFTHGDFDGSNILYDESQGMISGIIDFEEAGQKGDAAGDFCALLAGFGREFLEASLAAYTHDVSSAMRRRIEHLAKRILFIELLYGIQVNDRRFIDNAMQRLHRAQNDIDPIGDWLDVSTSETRE